MLRLPAAATLLAFGYVAVCSPTARHDPTPAAAAITPAEAEALVYLSPAGMAARADGKHDLVITEINRVGESFKVTWFDSTSLDRPGGGMALFEIYSVNALTGAVAASDGAPIRSRVLSGVQSIFASPARGPATDAVSQHPGV